MNYIDKFLRINILNSIIIFTCVLLYNLNQISSIGSISMIFIAFGYTFYLLSRPSCELILYQLTYSIISTVIIEYLFACTHFVVPFEVELYTDIISLIILMKIIINYKNYIVIFRDSIFVIFLFGIIFEIFYCILMNVNVLDSVNAFRMYFRFLPLYIIVYRYIGNVNFGEKVNCYKIYYYINICFFIILVILGLHQDNRNGIFGLAGTTSFGLFMMISLSYFTFKYIKKEITFKYYLFNLLVTNILFIIQESKAMIGINFAIVIIIFLVNKTSIIRKTVNWGIIVFAMIIAVNGLIIIFPGFSSMVEASTRNESINNYLFKNNNKAFEMGRFEALDYLNSNELITNERKALGLGIGSAMYPENWYYDRARWGRGAIYNTCSSELYRKYGGKFGYHLSSLNIVYLETGIVGIVAVILIIFISIKRSIQLIRKSGNNEFCVCGNIALSVVLLSIVPITYASSILQRNFAMLVFFILGYLSNMYYRLKIISGEEHYEESKYNCTNI